MTTPIDKKQKTLGIGKWCGANPNAMNLKLIKFNKEKTREVFKMTIIDELTFRFVVIEKFKKFR